MKIFKNKNKLKSTEVYYNNISLNNFLDTYIKDIVTSNVLASDEETAFECDYNQLITSGYKYIRAVLEVPYEGSMMNQPAITYTAWTKLVTNNRYSLTWCDCGGGVTLGTETYIGTAQGYIDFNTQKFRLSQICIVKINESGIKNITSVRVKKVKLIGFQVTR